MKCSFLSVHADRHWWKRGAMYALILLCVSFFLLASSHEATALTTVPTKMNFQGRLTNSSGNIMPDGVYNMKFRLFTTSSGGSSVWNEDRLVSASKGVTVTNGLFSARLGEATDIPASVFASGDLFFEIELPTPATATTSGAPTWTEGPMTPRNQLSTSAYAFNSETLDGLDSAAFLQAAGNNTLTGTNLFQTTNAAAVKIQNAGGADLFAADTSAMKVGIGLANPTLGRLHVTWVTGDSDPAIYGGSSSGSNNQIGVYGRSGSGVGVQGVSGTGTGVQGSSTSNVGVAGTSVSSIGVQGRSDTSTSGLFVSTNVAGTNASTTLVTRASTSQTSDIFQAQDSGNVALFKINADGSVRTKVGTGLDSATAFVIQDAGGNEMLTADSIADRLYVGDTTADGTGVLLVLDTKNTSGDPTGTSGGIYYNSNTGKFRCYENGAWRNCISSAYADGETIFSYFRDFIGTANDAVTINGVDGTANAGSNALQTSEVDHPGIVRVSTGTASTAGRASWITGAAATSSALILGNSRAWTMGAMISNVSTSDAGNPYNARIGFIDNVNAESTDGCYFRYSHSINGGDWEAVCRDNGVETGSTCDTNVVGAASAWRKMDIGVNAAGTSAVFAIDGTQVCTINSNIPTGSTEHTGFGITVMKAGIGSTAKSVDIDYIRALGEGLVR